MKLYKEDDLVQLDQRIKVYRLIYILSFVLIVISTTLGLLLSSYYHKLLAMILCSIVNVICFIFLVFFASKCSYIRHLKYEVSSLLNSQSVVEKYKVVSISENPITLPDGSMCYEVTVSKEDKQRFLYLSELFDKELLEVGKTYSFAISFDYITEINYED